MDFCRKSVSRFFTITSLTLSNEAHLSPQTVEVSPDARDTPSHRWYSSPTGFPHQAQLVRSVFVGLFLPLRCLTSVRYSLIFGWRQKALHSPPLSAFLPRVWTLQLDSCRRCHRATLLLLLLCDADAWLVCLPSYGASKPARAVCSHVCACVRERASVCVLAFSCGRSDVGTEGARCAKALSLPGFSPVWSVVIDVIISNMKVNVEVHSDRCQSI